MESYMKKVFLIISLWLICTQSYCQTVIQMTHPEDANIILLETFCKDSADIIVYKTTHKTKSEKWDLMWKFKKFGFSNFSVFIARSTTELYAEPYEEDSNGMVYYPYHAKVYFTDNKEERGYKRKDFALPELCE